MQGRHRTAEAASTWPGAVPGIELGGTAAAAADAVVPGIGLEEMAAAVLAVAVVAVADRRAAPAGNPRDCRGQREQWRAAATGAVGALDDQTLQRR